MGVKILCGCVCPCVGGVCCCVVVCVDCGGMGCCVEVCVLVSVLPGKMQLTAIRSVHHGIHCTGRLAQDIMSGEGEK